MDKLVDRLNDYMKIKGLLMQANNDPKFKKSDGGKFYYSLLSHLEK